MKRVRKDVCHVWSHQLQSDARYGNIYFQGDTIYSYGSHFPMARHVTVKGKHVVLFTTRRRGCTTSGHLNETRGAIPPDVPVFHVDDVMKKPSKADLKNYSKRIAVQSLVCAVSRTQAEWNIGELQKLVDQSNAFCETFGFKTRFTMPANLDEMKALSAEHAAKETKSNKAKDRQAKDRLAKEAAELADKLAQWLQGASVHPGRFDGYDYLRLTADGKEVETTQRAIVPLKHVNRVAKLILRKATAGQSWHSNGETIRVGEYQLDHIYENGNVRVGCHLFARSEIERFAGVLGVK